MQHGIGYDIQHRFAVAFAMQSLHKAMSVALVGLY